VARSYADKDLKLLFGKSGFYCCFPRCRNRLIAAETELDNEAILGFIAHIIASSDQGPRADPALSEADRNRYPNLILLCGHHHMLVDKQENEYTTEDLRRWKAELELWVEERLTDGMRDVNFAELSVVCEGIIAGTQGLASTGMTAVPPAEKMTANALTDASSYRMTIGLMQAPQVAHFLGEYASRIDDKFPTRLRQGFVAEYEVLVHSGLSGDALFYAMHDFSSTAATRTEASADERFQRRAAALAVLCHLFEVCDVFEVPRRDPA